MSISTKQLWTILLALTFSLATNANAAEQSEEDALLARATEYWNLRIKGDLKSIEFYAPTKAGTLPRDVPEHGNVRFGDYRIKSVTVDGDQGVVVVVVPPPPILTKNLSKENSLASRLKRPTINEKWVKLDGVWRKKPVNRSLSRLMAGPRPEAADETEDTPARTEGEEEGGA